MAKFLTSFSICPLIDQQCFIDVRQDSEPNSIIVTMGKSIVMRFRLPDQRQLSSWTCQDKLSAAVVYDIDRECYVGIFNDEYLGSWVDHKELKKLRKIKLSGSVHDLITYPGSRPLVVFRDGEVASLDQSGDTLTSLCRGYILPGETISRSDVVFYAGTWHLVSLVENSNGGRLNFTPLKGKEGFSIYLKRIGEKLCSFSVAEDILVTVWSDGLWVQSPIGPRGFPGRKVGLLEGLDCGKIGVAASAGDGLIALAGPASSGEGACVCLLDATRGLVAASVGLKLLPARPRLWVTGDNLALPAGPSLTVIPFKRAVLRLDSLLGVRANAVLPPILTSWERPENIRHSSKEDGLPESAVVCQDINVLLERGAVLDAASLIVSVNDAPDSCVIDTLAALLKSTDDQTNTILKLLEVPVIGDADTHRLVRNRLGDEGALKLLNILAVEELNSGGIAWAALLLDSFYQQLLLGGRSEVRESLQKLQDHVTSAREDARAARELYCELAALSHKPQSKAPVSVQYAVEKLLLY